MRKKDGSREERKDTASRIAYMHTSDEKACLQLKMVVVPTTETAAKTRLVTESKQKNSENVNQLS